MTWSNPFDLRAWLDPASYEVPRALVEPVVRALRLVNSGVDQVFYDVPGLAAALAERDRQIATMQGAAGLPSDTIDLGALSDPEGCLLLIDPETEPYVRKFATVAAFLDSPEPAAGEVAVVSITGVGSSALGSAAFAWAIARARGEPVLAIVPGYGLADMVQQGMGGWFALGLHDWLNTKSVIQTALTRVVPDNAKIGRRLSASLPDTPTHNDAPLFRFGSGSADVLHALICGRVAPFRMLVGHSKGALQIADAIRSLPAAKTAGLDVRTLGCPIAEEIAGVGYTQFLGVFDALGQMNMWGHWPDVWTGSWHTTDPWLPPAMDVALAVQ